MKTLLIALLVAAMVVATGVGGTSAQSREAGPSEASGLTPLFGGGSLGCVDFCVDVFELKCPTAALSMDIALNDSFEDNERFQVLLNGVTPTTLYGKADTDWAQDAFGAFVSLSRATAGSIKALMSVIHLAPTTIYRDYDFEFHCHGTGGIFKTGSYLLKQNQ